ncbi:MAG: EamA family transporter [Campylobacteraceae bacterium]|nr:EamA family transporter [Campylobacteraceae bacterium]
MNNKLLFLIILSLFFLASNSLLVKWALLQNSIDPYSFTLIRLLSGALVLNLYLVYKEKKLSFSFKENFLSSFVLFSYAICFSYAYIGLDAGLGTLILFSSVQLSMIFLALRKKERINIKQGLGILLALSGLMYLLYPNQAFELSYFHVFLIIIAGISWAIYSVLGKTKTNILKSTTQNFTLASIFLLIFYIFFQSEIHISQTGIVLALLSGTLTSALAYVLWYFILQRIKITTASIIQLAVPIIAIFISILFLGESLSLKLLLSSAVILLGIAISLV